MTQARTLDVSKLPAYEISSQSLLWAGQFLLCVIEGTLLLILAAVYFYLRLSVDIWPPPGVVYPPLLWSTVALAPLLVSCAGSYMASEAAKRGDRRGMLVGLITNVVLALVFLAFRAAAWMKFNFTWASDVHGSIVWTIMFLHTYDMVADVLMTIVLIVIIASGRYGPKQRVGVHVDSVVWYFLAGIWIPLYAIVFWGPRIIGGGS